MKRTYFLFAALSLCASVLFFGCSGDENNPASPQGNSLTKTSGMADSSANFNGVFRMVMNTSTDCPNRVEMTVTFTQTGTSLSGTIREVVDPLTPLCDGTPTGKGTDFLFTGLKGTVLESGRQAYIPLLTLGAGEYRCDFIDTPNPQLGFETVDGRILFYGVDVTDYCEQKDDVYLCQGLPEEALAARPEPGTTCGYDEAEQLFGDLTATLSEDGKILTFSNSDDQFIRQ